MSRICYNKSMREEHIFKRETDLHYEEKQEGNDDYNITAMATTFGQEDRNSDIIDSNAFNASVKAINNGTEKLKILHNHNRDAAIGVWTKAKKTKEGIILYGRISKATEFTKNILALVRDGVYDKVSIGFIAKEIDEIKNGFRILKGELVECSIVAVPANNNANILSVKEYKEMLDKEESSARGGICYNKDDGVEFDNFIKRLESNIFTQRR